MGIMDRKRVRSFNLCYLPNWSFEGSTFWLRNGKCASKLKVLSFIPQKVAPLKEKHFKLIALAIENLRPKSINPPSMALRRVHGQIVGGRLDLGSKQVKQFFSVMEILKLIHTVESPRNCFSYVFNFSYKLVGRKTKHKTLSVLIYFSVIFLSNIAYFYRTYIFQSKEPCSLKDSHFFDSQQNFTDIKKH